MVGYLFTHHQNGDKLGTSLVVQWLGFCAFTTEGLRSIPGQETKYLQAARHSQKKKKDVCGRVNLKIIQWQRMVRKRIIAEKNVSHELMTFENYRYMESHYTDTIFF